MNVVIWPTYLLKRIQYINISIAISIVSITAIASIKSIKGLGGNASIIAHSIPPKSTWNTATMTMTTVIRIAIITIGGVASIILHPPLTLEIAYYCEKIETITCAADL